MPRRRLQTIEHTRDLLVLCERSLYFPRVIFFAISLVPLAGAVRSVLDRDLEGALVSAVIFALFFAAGLFAAVEAGVQVNRISGALRIERRLWRWRRIKEYSERDVLTIFEEQTVKGNRLRMQLLSGQTKNITLFLDHSSLSAQAAALNHFLHRARKYHALSPPPAIHSSIKRIRSENT